jgi:hypothetical protein
MRLSFDAIDGIGTEYEIPVKRLEDRVACIWIATTAGIVDPFVEHYCQELLRWSGCVGRSELCKLVAAYYTVHELIQYRDDPAGFDWFKSLERARQERTGDCGTYSVAIATVLRRWAFGVGVRVIAQSKDWDHVFGLAYTRGLGVVPLDASVRRRAPGWQPARSKFWRMRDFRYDEQAWVKWWRSGRNLQQLPPV